MDSYEYDVALSFAGEDRKHASKLAKLLTDNSIKVFYDDYEQASLWGKNLYDHLSLIYSKKSKYCIMFLSKYYASKVWTTLERKNAQERAFKDNIEYILPVKIDDTEIPGITSTIGYLDMRDISIEEIAELVIDKLNLSSNKSMYHKLGVVNDIKIPQLHKNYSKLEKDKYLKETFLLIKEYFQHAVEAVKNKYSKVDVEFDEINKYKFVAKVYVNGELNNQCKIWIGGLMADNSISYSEGNFNIQQDNSLNDSISVEEDGFTLYLKPLGLNFFHNIPTPEKANQQQAAEYFWSKLIQHLS
jgi:hypothetical protein